MKYILLHLFLSTIVIGPSNFSLFTPLYDYTVFVVSDNNFGIILSEKINMFVA